MTLQARRRFLRAAAGSAAAAAIGIGPVRFALAQPRASSAPGAARRVEQLADNLHLVPAGEDNLVAMTGPGGTLLVDGGPADKADALMATIAALPGAGAVHTLFNTCWHPEQTGANERLGHAGATIIAHENARLWMTTDITWPWNGRHFAPAPAIARPNRTFYTKESLTVDGNRIDYGHVRASPHTDGDCYVFFRDANVLAAGNAVTGAGWPAIDWRTGGWLGGIVGALELLLVLADDGTQIVPARGPVLRRADIEMQHRMFDVLYERFVNLLYDGKSVAEAVAARPTEEFDAAIGPSDRFVARAFESLWGYLTPDA